MPPPTGKPKLECFRTEDAHLIPPDYPDGPPGTRLPVGDAIYCTWILGNVRMVSNARYGVSETAHALGTDEAVAQLGPIGFVERWKMNQAGLYYWAQNIDFMLKTNPMSEADVAPARPWALLRRSSFYWYMGAAEDGALLYDIECDLLFVVKGLMSGIVHLLETNILDVGGSTMPLMHRRVVISGLTGRPDLNGQRAYAFRHDPSAGRYGVIIEGTSECVRVREGNLALAHPDAPDVRAPLLTYLTLLPFEGNITYDGIVCALGAQGETEVMGGAFGAAWRAGAAAVNDRAAEIRKREPIRVLEAPHAKLQCSRWIDGPTVRHGMNVHPALRGKTLSMPGELQLIPNQKLGPPTAKPEDANLRAWWN